MCIDQCQNQLQLTNKQVVPNEVTCNPTDDTARDDELSNSFASCRRTSNHGSNYFHNQNSNHQNGFAHSTSGAKHSTNHDNQLHQVQPRSNVCPMLPPPDNNHNYNGSQKSYIPVDQQNHHDHRQGFASPASGAKHSTHHGNSSHQLQPRSNVCPTMPPLGNEHNHFQSQEDNAPVDHYNHHTHRQSHFGNASMNHSSHQCTEQSLQKKSKKQPPKKSFIGRKSKTKPPAKAISQFYKDSIASTDTSGNCNGSTATNKGITVQTQVRLEENLYQLFFYLPLYVIVFLYVFNIRNKMQIS